MPINHSKKKILSVLSLLISFLVLFSSAPLLADTLFLKNKEHVEGIIEKENKDIVEINLGFGTTAFNQIEIDHIVKSDSKETEAIWQKWGEEKKEIEKRKPEEERKWKERQVEIERIRLEELNLKKEQNLYGPKSVKTDAKDGQILLNVLLNEKIRASLLLDSGAGAMVITRRIANQLGIDADKLTKAPTQVADGRWVDMGVTTLKSVKVQNVELTGPESQKKPGVQVDNVDTYVVLDEASDKNRMGDGLLGMAFLKNFKFNADYKNGSVTFERLKDEAQAEKTI